jgi:TPR repeat protein/transglutaminase-like putative cysteine protease
VRAIAFGIGVALCASTTFAADQPAYAPPSGWVRQLTIPQAEAPNDGSPIQPLLINRQANLTSDGDEIFLEQAFKVLTPEGLNLVTNFTATWDPSTDLLTIHKLHILRGGTVIDLLAGGKTFVVLRRETNLELAMLDGRLTATMQPEGLQVGDVLDMAMTLKHKDPILAGYSTAQDRLSHFGVAERVYMRALWPKTKAMRWRETDGLAPAQISPTPLGSELVIDMSRVEAPKPPRGAPARFADLGTLEVSEFASWADVARLVAPLYEKAETLAADSPLRVQIEKIAAAATDPKLRALAALRLVQEQTRYALLAMSDAGLVPADADVTWTRRFGDCKGKTALLIALLHGLGLKAQPALVNTTFGGGLDQRLPQLAFDHVLVRAEIGGKIYWLDGTRTGDRNLDDLTVPPYSWALPVQATGAELVKLEPQTLAHPNLSETVTIDASAGPDTPAPTHIDVVYRGEAAAAQRQQLSRVEKTDFDRIAREAWTKANPWLDVQSVVTSDDPTTGLPHLSLDGSARLDWLRYGDSGVRFYRIPQSNLGADISFNRQPGPHRDAPYAVDFPSYNERIWKITLPKDADFALLGADVSKTLAGQAFVRASRIENGVLTVELSGRTIEPEFPAMEADADAAGLRELFQSGVAVTYRHRPDGSARPPTNLSHDEVAGIAAGAAGVDLDIILAGAAKGDPLYENKLAKLYQEGRGVPFDLATASEWYAKSAATGNARGEGALGLIDVTTADPLKLTEGVSLLRKAAGEGDAEAESNLAALYLAGQGVAKDDAEAVKLIQKAVAQAFPPAEYQLGSLYAVGQGGVTPDSGTAVQWFRKAADQGLAPAQDSLARAYGEGLGVPKEAGQALAWARKAAEQGDGDGYYLVGQAYEWGRGVSRDYGQAMLWYLKSSGVGDPQGEAAIAALYYSGLGIAKDVNQSLAWEKKAADRGWAPAQNTMGYEYLKGVDVPRDYTLSLAWLHKAAAQGEPAAQNTLGTLYEDGEGVSQDYKQALAWFQKSAEHNHSKAFYNIAMMYKMGLGVARDNTVAVSWLKHGAKIGQIDCEFVLGTSYLFGIGGTAMVSQGRRPKQRGCAGQPRQHVPSRRGC